MKRLLTTLAMILAFGMLTVSLPVLAQTPDWMTPAIETICDNESGAAFGLCNAYCEAMDCELANDDDPLTEPSASQSACDKVRSKYQQQAGKDLPCEVSCPCIDPTVSQNWVDVTNGIVELDNCIEDSNLPEYDNRFVTTSGAIIAFSGDFRGLGGSLFCSSTDGSAGPLTPTQHDFCRQELEDAAALYGLECVPWE